MTRTYHFSVRRRASVVYPMLIFETWVGYNAASNTAGTSVAAKGDYVTITGAEFSWW